MKLLIYSSSYTGNKNNCQYNDKHLIESKQELIEALKYDHVCAEYVDNYRGADRFIGSNTIVMDIDNDNSDMSKDWLDKGKLLDMFDDVSFALATSRNHMKQKGEKAPRPKYHIYFEIPFIENAKDYADLKRKVAITYPFFDDNALDAARFIFGNPDVEVEWHEGYLSIDDLVVNANLSEFKADCGLIKEGGRNNYLSRYAGRVAKRFGVNEKAKSLFLQRAAYCDPPLPDEEIETIWASACKFYNNKVLKQDAYVKPEDYNNVFTSESLKPDDYSDIGQAKVLTREYKDELCYSDATDYLRYDGEVWRESKQHAIGAVEEFLDLQYGDALEQVDIALDAMLACGQNKEEVIKGGKKYEESIDGKVLELYKKYKDAVSYKNFVLKRRDMKFLISAMQAAKPMLEVKVQDLDGDEFLLNTPGLTVDLRKGMDGGRLPSANDLITKQTLTKPSEEGESLWLEALDTFFCKDKELIEYVQKIVGLSAIGKVYVEALIIAYGEGRNGKSTFWNTISRVLGSYAGGLSADALTIGCRRNIKPEMAELKGKRLIIASELEEGMRLNNSIVKQLCSTDNIQGEKKFKDPFSFEPSHTVVLYTNHLPKVGANDFGIWRRLIVIPFNAKINGDNDIKNYSDYLIKNAGGAIMKWIIEGSKKAIDAKYKFDMPACVLEAVNSYKDDNDWLGQFLDECCILDNLNMSKSGELYKKYREYCSNNSEYTRSTTDFYTALEKLGFIRKKTKSGVIIQGLSIKMSDFLD